MHCSKLPIVHCIQLQYNNTLHMYIICSAVCLHLSEDQYIIGGLTLWTSEYSFVIQNVIVDFVINTNQMLLLLLI